MHVEQMIAAHPAAAAGRSDSLTRCIEACFDCAQACTACADACLAEPTVGDLIACIRLDLDCGDVCMTTGRVLSRHTAGHAALKWQLLETCAGFCRLCAEECDRHASHHEHCRICADACRACERACHQVMTTGTVHA
jgi:hypothetical protein